MKKIKQGYWGGEPIWRDKTAREVLLEQLRDVGDIAQVEISKDFNLTKQHYVSKSKHPITSSTRA